MSSRRADNRRTRQQTGRTKPDKPSEVREPAAQVTSAVARLAGIPLSCWLLSAALFAAALGGGILYDRVFTGSGPADPIQLIGTPLATILVSLGLLSATWNRGEAAGSVATGHARVVAWLFGLFFCWVAISLTHSRYMHASVTMLALSAASLAAGAIAHRAARSGIGLVTVSAALAGAGTLISIIGAREYLRELRGGNPLWRVFATFVNPDFLAGFLVMCVPISVALLLATRRPAEKSAAAAALLLQSVCLVLTGSRLGLLTLVLSLALFAMIALRGGLLTAQTKRVALAGIVILSVGVVAAGRPLLRRLLASGSESYSAQFRTRTWEGAKKMAYANPLVGTGFGTFDTAYPRYAVVGYTQHAHSAYLQVAAETGMPGVALFVAGLLGTTWLGIVFAGTRKPADREVESDAGQPGTDPNHTARILAAGFTAALAAAMLHNLTDSDAYVPANAIAMGVVIGALLGLAQGTGRDSEPATVNPRWDSLRKGMASLAAGCLFLLSCAAITSRTAANTAEYEVEEASNLLEGSNRSADSGQRARGLLDQSIIDFRQAEARDPLNPDLPLRTAAILEPAGRRKESEQEIRGAIRRAPIGKAYYRLGKLYSREGMFAEAVQAHEQARKVEPNNLDNLLALADSYALTNRGADAESVYRAMVVLARGDFGRIRAIPELVEWQYGRAYQGLGEAEMQRRGANDIAAAIADLKDAVAILGTFWKQRDLLIAQIRIRPDERRRTMDYYAKALADYAATLRAGGKISEAVEVESKAAEFGNERESAKSTSLSP